MADTVHVVLGPASAFSKAVFQVVRPHVPRERWPRDCVRATVRCSRDGLWLEATFDGLPPTFAQVATQAVKAARVDLVVTSPFATIAAGVVKAKRWRDSALYGLVPSLFAIPLLGALNDAAMKVAGGVFAVNLLALVVFHLLLTRHRSHITKLCFVADIPVPGLRLHATPADTRPQEMPEV